jgi:tetratricopeptide (TPR) repeat protein
LVLNDRNLEIHNGELRHQGYLERAEMPYKNNFDLKKEHYYKSEKDYSGAALDDLRLLVLQPVGGRVSEKENLRLDLLESKLDELINDLRSRAGEVVAALAVGAKVRLVVVDREEMLKARGFELRRPEAAAFEALVSAGMGSACRTSSDEEAGVCHKKKKSKKAANGLSDSEDEGADEDDSVDALKRAAGVNVGAMDRHAAILRAEEKRTERPVAPAAPALPADEWNHLGKAAEGEGLWAEALECHEKDFAEATDGDRVGKTVALKNMGLCHQELHKWHSATNCLNQALLMARAAVSEKECGAEDEEQRCLLELGNFHMRRFDASRDVDHFDYAVVHYEAADALARKLLARSNVAESREACARAAYSLGDAVRSAGAYKRAQALFREAAPNLAEASMRFDCLEALGDVSLEREDHDEAASAFTKALEVLTEVRQLWPATFEAEASEEVDTLQEWPEGRLLWKLAQGQLEKAAAEGDADAAAARETLGQLEEAGQGRCSIRVVARAIRLLQPMLREVRQLVGVADAPIDELASEGEGEQQDEEEQEEVVRMESANYLSAHRDPLSSEHLHEEPSAPAEPVAASAGAVSARVPAAVLHPAPPRLAPPRGFQNVSASRSSAAARSDRRLRLQKKLGVAPRKVPTEEEPHFPPAVMPTESVVMSTSPRAPRVRVRIDVVPPEEWTHVAQWNRDLWRRTIDSARSGIPIDPWEGHGSERALFQFILNGTEDFDQ